MTTPNGTPAWTRAADFSFYGGHVDKANYNGEPIVNPRTDVGAGAIQRMASDLAAVTRMAPFCTISFHATTTGSSITVLSCRMMTGETSASYAGTSPPTGFPSVTHVSAQVYDIAIGGLYSDDYSVNGIFEPAFAKASCVTTASIPGAYATGTSSVYVETGVTYGTYSVEIS